MQYDIEESGLSVTMTAANFDVVVTASAPLEVAVGECARIDVGEAVNYIKSGQAEIGAAVDIGVNRVASSVTDGISDFNLNALSKTNDFNQNASQKQALVDAAAATAQYYAENVKFGMVRKVFAASDWILQNGKYALSYGYDVVSAVYKQNGNNYELMTNIDIKSSEGSVTIFSPEVFAGYALLVNSAEKTEDKHFVFEQEIPSNLWHITHNLDKRPSVTVVDSAGNMQMPDEVTYESNNAITVKFLGAFAGKAFLN
jgi:hypothetical protein